MDVFEFIAKHTEGVSVVVELGAGKFDKLLRVADTVERRIGFEVHEHAEEIDDPRIEKIYASLFEWNLFVRAKDRDCVMLIDVLEHLERHDADRLLADLRRSFRRVLVFTPLGFRPQGQVEDNYYNIHRSGWTEQCLQLRGFTTWAEPEYTGGSLFGRWDLPT